MPVGKFEEKNVKGHLQPILISFLLIVRLLLVLPLPGFTA